MQSHEKGKEFFVFFHKNTLSRSDRFLCLPVKEINFVRRHGKTDRLPRSLRQKRSGQANRLILPGLETAIGPASSVLCFQEFAPDFSVSRFFFHFMLRQKPHISRTDPHNDVFSDISLLLQKRSRLF